MCVCEEAYFPTALQVYVVPSSSILYEKVSSNPNREFSFPTFVPKRALRNQEKKWITEKQKLRFGIVRSMASFPDKLRKRILGYQNGEHRIKDLRVYNLSDLGTGMRHVGRISMLVHITIANFLFASFEVNIYCPQTKVGTG